MRVNGEAIHEELMRLNDAGRLTPTNAVDAARDPNNPMHGEFEWDDAIAGEKYRLQQARELIGSFQITQVVMKTEHRVQEFVRDPRKSGDEQGYRRITEIKTDEQMRREFMQQELEIARGHVRRTQDFAAVLGYAKQVARVETQLDSLIGRVSAEALGCA